ncbi:hypothetical protein T459_03187 [Capsicum annuum]|uniref:Uncharacterized protein n=1 Tax=Capsicum annuum TaxID=4072 RepID=A0A2G3AM43_CAPAN|nr:hypothetical protein T459_03187 [Capsicum annuum]
MDFRAFDAGTASAKQEARLLFQGVAQFVNALQVWNSLTQTSKCQQHFDVYKECKKKEREARLERNQSRSLFS